MVRDRSGQTDEFRLGKLDAPHVIAVLRPVNVQRGLQVLEGVFHIQNVNAYDSRLKTWMRRFHGVATKYLEHYLGWRRLLERYRGTISPMLCLNEAVGRLATNS